MATIMNQSHRNKTNELRYQSHDLLTELIQTQNDIPKLGYHRIQKSGG